VHREHQVNNITEYIYEQSTVMYRLTKGWRMPPLATMYVNTKHLRAP
jgi:hypothetical protein